MFDRFDRLFVINLPSRTDRRAETETELARTGDTRAVFFDATRPRDEGKFRSIGEHGCYMSHLAILQNNVGCKNLVVMEDDVSFTPDLIRAEQVLASLPVDWDLFYAGHEQLSAHKSQWDGEGVVRVAPHVKLIGLHCYLVNGGAIGKLAAFFQLLLSRQRGDPAGGPMPADGALNWAREQLHLKTYAAVPQICFQRSSRTDIGQKKWFDDLPAFRGVVDSGRKLKNRLSRSPMSG